METLIRCHILWHLIWVCTVCQLLFYRSPDYNGWRHVTCNMSSSTYYYCNIPFFSVKIYKNAFTSLPWPVNLFHVQKSQISILSTVCQVMWFRYSLRKMAELFANRADPDQMPQTLDSTVCQFSFLGSPDWNGLILFDQALTFELGVLRPSQHS